MESTRRASNARRRVRRILALTSGILILVVALGLGAARAALRAGVGYLISIDSLDSGGGGAASASYLQPDSAVGQGSVVGWTDVAGIRNHNGVVQDWTPPQAAAAAWLGYSTKEGDRHE